MEEEFDDTNLYEKYHLNNVSKPGFNLITRDDDIYSALNKMIDKYEDLDLKETVKELRTIKTFYFQLKNKKEVLSSYNNFLQFTVILLIIIIVIIIAYLFKIG